MAFATFLRLHELILSTKYVEFAKEIDINISYLYEKTMQMLVIQ